MELMKLELISLALNLPTTTPGSRKVVPSPLALTLKPKVLNCLDALMDARTSLHYSKLMMNVTDKVNVVELLSLNPV